MAEAFKFELVSPEKLVLSADVDSVVVPGTDGELTVLARHAPMMTTIRPGVVAVKGAGLDKRIFVPGGFAEMGAQGLTILAEQAFALDELDRAKLEQSIKDAEEDVSDAKDEAKKAAAAEKLAGLKALASAA
jgi:F-type H+-transporting ATPase subunit epsilon